MKNGFILKPSHIKIPDNPKRIISLVPSQTELLAYLGLENEVIAITRFCIFPERWYKNKTRVGGTKKLHLDKIKELAPDLIIANKEENTKEEIEELAKYFSVYVTDVLNLDGTLLMIEEIGRLCGKLLIALNLNEQIKKEINKIQSKNYRELRIAYFIWKAPWMAVGKGVFIDAMMQLAGFKNVFAEERYPAFELDELKKLKPELLLLSSEPYPFSEKHIPELQKEFPDCRIETVNGEIFSWYGNHILKTPDYLIALRRRLDE